MSKRAEIRPGDVVALRKGVSPGRCAPGRVNNRTAVVQRLAPDIAEGAIVTAEDLHGMKFWNVAELRLVRRGQG